jgi:D-arabinose 1-dehydrogenase-like Zn-dependent alcohol dehydrogenase
MKEQNSVWRPRVLPLPSVSPHADAGLTGYHAVKRARCWSEAGDTVVPIGFGGLGQSAFPIAHALVQSIVVGRSEQTLDHAQELGHAAPSELTASWSRTSGKPQEGSVQRSSWTASAKDRHPSEGR